ncbi:MAG: Trk system potassium transporter TrkA [Alphaproteobacteria bacterium]|nr:MAG: Trk system potassium transporter TrkA [Alphaproteobacteria bacterium]
MSLIICGAGRVGYYLTRYLSKAGYAVTVIDSDPDIIRDISEELDVQAVCGRASHPSVLVRAGAESADVILALTQIDEMNMAICEVVHALFPPKKKVARIRNHAYLMPRWSHLFDAGNLSIDHVISPELEVAESINESLRIPGSFSAQKMASGQVYIIGARCRANSPIVNTPLSHIIHLFPQLDATVLGILRKGQAHIPKSDDVILEDDDIYVCIPASQTSLLMRAFGLENQDSQRLIILGGGQIGYNLARIVEKDSNFVDVRIIERDMVRAQYVSEELSDATVICGDALDAEIIEEAGTSQADLVVALTQDDRVNALAGLLAKNHGAHKVLSLINNEAYAPLVPRLGIDGVINPRAVTLSRVMEALKGEAINQVYSLNENLGEVLEVRIAESTALIGQSVGDIHRGYGVRIGCLLRAEGFVYPSDATILRSGDRVIMLVPLSLRQKIHVALGMTL